MHVETQSESTIASGHKATLVSTIEPSKILDLTISKQTQYYTLWGVYTVVQFATANYGSGAPL
ncbi:MAG TPA: hypothetical protein VKE26_13505 [Xanthobacteraceae bacterium]|nr:hypothetical protein [Xanthobacteraceae bacterium]